MTKREFHYHDNGSAKFWRIERTGCVTSVQFGRIGSDGQAQSKSFPDELAAEHAYAKQIAEKIKKGYQEVGVANTLPAAAAAPPATPPAPTVITPAAPPAPAAISAATTTAGVTLDPTDWLWATWREWQPLERPAAPAFDQADAVRRLARVSNDVYQSRWDWDRAQITGTPSRAEAHFWLVAMLPHDRSHTTPKQLADLLATTPPKHDPRITPKQLADALAGQQFDGMLSAEAALALLDTRTSYLRPITLALLAACCSPSELIAAIVDTFDPSTNAYHQQQRGVTAVVNGLRQYVLPYLNLAQRIEMGQKLTTHLDPALWPNDYYAAGPPAFYIAAMLGGHGDALRRLVESWADDRFTSDSWNDYHQRPQEIVLGLADPQLVEMHMRRLKLRLNKPEYIRAWLAHTELAALDVVRDSILQEQSKERAPELLQAFAAAVGPEVAPHMLELMQSSRAPQLARDWLEAHPAHTIAGLLPVADGRGKLADAATDLLHRFARRGYAGAIAEALAALPNDRAARLRANILDSLLDQRPLLDASTTPQWLRDGLAAQTDSKPVKPSQWLHAADLPQIIIENNRLSAEQINALLGALRQSKLDAPHPLVAALKQHADAASLDLFAWALFEQWLAAGAPSKENWALFTLGLLGGNATALKLAALVRIWPGESQHQRAVAGLECLRTIGSDTALMQISGIAQKVKFKGLQARAAECMELVAKQRGLSRAQLEDRVVPDCDLDARGERVFDYGPRQFRFALGPDMKPMLRDQQGIFKTDLPKPGAKDDATLAAQTVAEWKLLKKQVAEVAKVQALRLEQAMVTGRRWSRAEFELLLVRHPLMTHLARTLVWGAYDGAGTLAATFRVTEDQTYADSGDQQFDLSAFAAVGVVHPLQVAQSDQAAWGEVLSDYAIVPPFPQLGRPIYHLEPGEQTATDITRFNHQIIPAASLVYGLDKLGWIRDAPADGGGFCGHFKPFEQANLTAVVQYEEGVAIGYIVEAPDQHLDYLVFVPGIRTPEWWPEHKNRLALSQVDPLVLSEAIGDLIVVMAKAK